MPKEGETVSLTVSGMTCTNCALGLERSLLKSGVQGATVSFADAEAQVVLGDSQTVSSVISAIEEHGFKAALHHSEAEGAKPFTFSIFHKFLVCAVFTLPLVGAMFVPVPALENPWVQLILCLPVVGISIFHFGRSAIGSLRRGVPNMDVLIILGVTAAFLYSLAGTLFALGAQYLFYETAATITTLVLLGNLIEERSVKKTTSAIEELRKLQLGTAQRVTNTEGREVVTDIPIEELVVGDTVLVNTGDMIPADGEIAWGSGTVDEAAITGESIPVERDVGDAVVGGTVLASGSIKATITATGSETFVAGLIRLVRDAQHDRPEIQRLGDRVSAVFVPVVASVALLTLFGSYLVLQTSFTEALLRAIAVLVIACPCAMGLATPTAVMVGIGRAARSGILLRGGSTIEKLAQLELVVFDKTGTLTTGDFDVSISALDGSSLEEVQRIIMALEQHSSHPIARSLRDHLASVTPAALRDVVETKGLKMEGRDEHDVHYAIGSSRLLSEPHDVPEADLYLLRDDVVIAAITLQDALKPDAVRTVNDLHESGVAIALLSGDSKRKCTSVAKTLGIEKVFAEQTPQQKLEVLRSLQTDRLTGFVGDGINDAPALALAGVGISLSSSTEAAIQSARVVLLGDELSRLVDAHRLAKATLRTIKQNLFWAFFYNVLAIPVAAAGFLNPMIAALTMGFSDVIVIGNSLRLRARKIEP